MPDAPAGGAGVSSLPPGVIRRALSEAVGLAVDRHVASAARASAAEGLQAGVERYVLRYGVEGDRVEGAERVLDVDVEVDLDRLLGDLAAAGVPVHRAVRQPRVLVAALPGVAVEPAVQAVAGELGREGRAYRLYPGDPGQEPGPAEAARWGRDLGCHVVFLLTAREGEPGPPPSGDPGGAGSAPGVPAVIEAHGWVVDVFSGRVLGEGRASGRSVAPDGVTAQARAAARAGKRLAWELIRVVEQADWAPGGGLRAVELQVSGLPGPRALEDLDRALGGLTEVRSLRVLEVGFREAVWSLEVWDTGLPWDVMLSWVRVEGGSLGAARVTGEGAPPGPVTVACRWIER